MSGKRGMSRNLKPISNRPARIRLAGLVIFGILSQTSCDPAWHYVGVITNDGPVQTASQADLVRVRVRYLHLSPQPMASIVTETLVFPSGMTSDRAMPPGIARLNHILRRILVPS